MRIAVLGGGPGGLLAALLAKRGDPGREVTVFERNRAGDTFGFGVVFSDATLDGIDAADPVLRRALTEHGVHWDPIEVRLRGERWRFGGNGMAAVARRDRPGDGAARAPPARAGLPVRAQRGPRPGRARTCCAASTTSSWRKSSWPRRRPWNTSWWSGQDVRHQDLTALCTESDAEAEPRYRTRRTRPVSRCSCSPAAPPGCPS